MDNQHQKITGYRDLSQTEIDLMNKIKRLGAELEMLQRDVGAHLEIQNLSAANFAVRGTDPDMRQTGIDEQSRLSHAEPRRWAAMAKTDLQTGLMKLVRAVAQPTTF